MQRWRLHLDLSTAFPRHDCIWPGRARRAHPQPSDSGGLCSRAWGAGVVAAGRTRRLLVRGTAGRWWCENGGDGGWGGRWAGGREQAGASDGGQNHQKRSRWAPIFQSGDEIEALVNRTVAVAGRAAPQSISAGGVDAQKDPPALAGVVAFQLGTGPRRRADGGAPPLWSATDFSRLPPRPEAQQEISGALARAATAYNFGTPAPPPQFHRIPFPPVLTLHFRRSSRPLQDGAPTTIPSPSA